MRDAILCLDLLKGHSASQRADDDGNRDAVSGLAEDPWPPGCKKLTGYDDLCGIRVGDWRISYAVEEDRLIVLVIEVAPRGDAYQF